VIAQVPDDVNIVHAAPVSLECLGCLCFEVAALLATRVPDDFALVVYVRPVLLEVALNLGLEVAPLFSAVEPLGVVTVSELAVHLERARVLARVRAPGLRTRVPRDALLVLVDQVLGDAALALAMEDAPGLVTKELGNVDVVHVLFVYLEVALVLGDERAPRLVAGGPLHAYAVDILFVRREDARGFGLERAARLGARPPRHADVVLEHQVRLVILWLVEPVRAARVCAGKLSRDESDVARQALRKLLGCNFALRKHCGFGWRATE